MNVIKDVLGFDNTHNVAMLAGKGIPSIPRGKETRPLRDGTPVTFTAIAPYKGTGKTVSHYKQHGYWYYIVKTDSGMTFTARTKDITKGV